MQKFCSACKINPKGKRHNYCNPCHAAEMREWRKTHPMTAEQRKKDSCRSYARMYEMKGALKKLPCQFCGDPNSQRHHPDYNKPLRVIYLCREHHLLHHQGIVNISHLEPQIPAVKNLLDRF